MNKRIISLLMVGLIIVEMICGTNVMKGYAAEQEKQLVKVAYFDIADYYQINQEGQVESYDQEYLARIEEMTNLQFEYVDCETWAKAIEMLQNQQIDLIGTMQKSAEREDTYAICNNKYGVTVAELVALPERQYVYEDYDMIGKSVIGTTGDYVRMLELNNLFKKQKINPELKYYVTQQELLDALETGEVDMIAANSHGIPKKYSVIDKFYYSSMYFASYKGNEKLIDTIDEALLEIELQDENFEKNMTMKYFPQISNSPFTKQELECIAENKTYTFYLDSATAPLVWYDEKDEKMKGILVELCNQIAKKTGLHFSYKMSSEYPQSPQDTDVRYHTNIYDIDSLNTPYDGISKSIFDSEYVVFHRLGDDNFVAGAKHKIAIIKNRESLSVFLNKLYKDCEISECDNPIDCIHMLQNKEVDLIVLDSFVADYALITQDINTIVEMPLEQTKFGIELEFQGEDKNTLADIVDKGISFLDQSTVNDIVTSYALSTVPNSTFQYMIKNNLIEFLVAVWLLALLFTVTSGALAYAMAMKKQKTKVEQATQSKAQFFARMSHDMRTPMNGILGIAELAIEEQDVTSLHKDMKKIMESGKYMLSLINDSLDVQRAETGKMKLEPQIVYCADIIENAIDMVKNTAKEKNINFQIHNNSADLDCYLRVDTIRLRQIFVNLLSNAMKFTPSGGTVELTIDCMGRDANIAHDVITVRDTGVGMSKEFLKNGIFKQFSQEQNKFSTTYSGTGLGLSIAKMIVEMMGGTIEVESEIGKGTTFTIYLDFERVEKEEAEIQKASRENVENVEQVLAGKRVLLCEDHPLNAEIAKRLLQKVECTVDWAENGKIGLMRFTESEQGTYDAVLMDIRMPELDGIETAKAMRACSHADAKNIPIIAMSANAFAEDKKQSAEAGMNAHLTKPVDTKELYRTLSLYINAKKAN